VCAYTHSGGRPPESRLKRQSAVRLFKYPVSPLPRIQKPSHEVDPLIYNTSMWSPPLSALVRALPGYQTPSQWSHLFQVAAPWVPKDRSVLASSLPNISRTMGNSGTWLQSLFRPWLATIYERRVARICRDCRVNEKWVSDSPPMAATTGGAPKVLDNLDLERRSHLFVKRCKEEWLELHIIGVFLSG